MNDHDCAVILFSSAHHALRGEKALKKAGLKHAVINTPREFTRDCGISIRVEKHLRGEAERVLREANVPYNAVKPYRFRWI